jgi:hypothetical protein
MNAFNTKAQQEQAAAEAAWLKANERNSGISVGVVAGVVGGVLGAVYMIGEGSSRNSALVGGALGAVCGWAAGNVTEVFEVFPGATGKILSGAVACSFGASCGALATQLIDGMSKIPGV